MSHDATPCKGCERSAATHVPEREVQRMVTEYLASHPEAGVVSDRVYAQRLEACRACADAQFAGTTCKHCGCLIAVRAKLASKTCPAPSPRWSQ